MLLGLLGMPYAAYARHLVHFGASGSRDQEGDLGALTRRRTVPKRIADRFFSCVHEVMLLEMRRAHGDTKELKRL